VEARGLTAVRAPRRGVWGWLIAAGVAVAPAVSLEARKPPKPPALLRDLLKVETSWRILDPAVDLVGDYTVKQLEDLDRWPPWIEGDFDKDDKDDLAAVVVRQSDSGTIEFTVVVIHGRTPGRGELVVPFAPRRILGVAPGAAEDTVTPQYCVECDTNDWYRWNGRAYEPLLHVIGDTVMISGEPGRRLTLFADPRADAERTANLSLCVKAEILQVGGTEGQRWYRVEVNAPESPRGWIPQQLVVQEVDCVR
jgi:hypothetical protein